MSDASTDRRESTPGRPWLEWAVGARVVVRRRRDLPPDAPPDEPRHTDVVGDVLRCDESGVLVRTRRGEVFVPGPTIALGKVIPPAPARRPR